MPPTITNIDTSEITYFTCINGEIPQDVAQIISDISSTRYDGQTYRREPRKARPFRLTATAHVNFAASADLRARLQELQAKLITYTDSFGRNFTNLICLAARIVDDRQILSPVGAINYATGSQYTQANLTGWPVAAQFVAELSASRLSRARDPSFMA